MQPALLQQGLQIRHRRRKKIIQYLKSLLNSVSQEKSRRLPPSMFVQVRLAPGVDVDADGLVLEATADAVGPHLCRKKNVLPGLVDVVAAHRPRLGKDALG